MKLYRSEAMPDRWIGEDQDGALVHWPKEAGGWERRTPYTGPKRGLQEVIAILARGTGWPGGGRGPAPRSDQPSNRRITLRATDAEADAWEERAGAEGKGVTVWARDELNAVVKRSKK